MSTTDYLHKRYKDLFISKRYSIFPFIFRKNRRSLEDFIIKKQLGSGFSGVIYLASPRVDPDLNVAIKVLNKNTTHSHNELKFHKKLESKHIVKFYDSFSDSKDHLFIVMEYSPLGDLCDKLLRETVFSEQATKPILIDICKAIKVCHDKNIVHGDIKKENVLIFDGCYKLIDFGLSFYETFNGNIIGGTFGYIAPEIARNLWHLCGKKVDIWALGVLTFELLTGYSPFICEDPLHSLDNIMLARYRIPRHISTGARDFIDSLLQLTPSLRPCIDEILNNKWLNSV